MQAFNVCVVSLQSLTIVNGMTSLPMAFSSPITSILGKIELLLILSSIPAGQLLNITLPHNEWMKPQCLDCDDYQLSHAAL